MFIFNNFVNAIASVIDIILELYKWIIIISAIISWVNPDPYNPIVRFLYSVTEPVLKPIRKAIGYRLGPIDISPIIVILVIIFLQSFLVASLRGIGMRMY
ncbi:MAG TPA: YggT family protein [Nitrospirae bacterium]|nr:YggT family protein [Nitrospirota bacterium]